MSETNTYRDLTKSYLNFKDPASASEEDYNLLLDVLRYHERKYYIDNDPQISDSEYDRLFKLAETIETEHPEWLTPMSPTQRVGTDLVSDLDPIQHLTPMLSLANSYDEADLLDFDKQVRKLLANGEDVEYTVEPKFDGGSIVVVYENDRLQTAATRGDGYFGEDITANIRTLRTVPLSADFSKAGIRKIELRGEALIRKDRFEKINAQREENGEVLFANPRNAATGGLRMKDPADTAKRGIEAFFYQISHIEGENIDGDIINSHYRRIELLRKLGFKVPDAGIKKCETIGEVVRFCEEWEARRESYDYEIDGMVVKVDRVDFQETLGSTSHHPRWAIAYKFKAKQATSTLEEVHYQVGKIGTITPVAKISPTQLAGVTISSISLHNEDFITGKDIRLGDQVLIERAGDVIPYIVKSFPEMRTGNETPIQFPTNCPVCDTPLVREKAEAAWRCPNINCQAQVLQRIIYHVSKDAMDIEGFGKALVQNFLEKGWLRNISDVYNLDYEQIKSLEGFGEKSVQNLKASIEKAKSNPLRRILTSLSIHHLGKRASALIAAEIKSIWDLVDWTEEDYLRIKDIGPVVAQNMREFFSVPENLEILKKMEEYGVDMSQKDVDKPVEVAADAPLADKTILFTGSLQTMTRNEAKKIAEENGAKNISAVSGNLDILVVGEKAGSKLDKARKLGTVQILTEDEFKQLLGLEG